MSRTVKVIERRDLKHLSAEHRCKLFALEKVEPRTPEQWEPCTLLIVFEDGIKIAMVPPKPKKERATEEDGHISET